MALTRSDPVQLTLVVIIISVLQYFLSMVSPPTKLGCVSHQQHSMCCYGGRGAPLKLQMTCWSDMFYNGRLRGLIPTGG
jgi:hypothetical protein